jgi:shikimate kinase
MDTLEKKEEEGTIKKTVKKVLRVLTPPTKEPGKINQPTPILGVRGESTEFGSGVKSDKFRKLLNDFVAFAADRYGMKKIPTIEIAKLQNTFGCYSPSENKISIVTHNRHPMDIFRTIAHELKHHDQNVAGRLGDVETSGATGSDIENEANAEAGKIMRWFAKDHPDMFNLEYVSEDHFRPVATHKKAVIVIGGPASGKDYIIKQAIHGYGLTEISPEQVKSSGAITSGKGVIISFAGSSAYDIGQLNCELSKAGYQAMLVFVHTTHDAALARSKHRKPQEHLDIHRKWDAAETLRPLLALAFSNNYIEFDNSLDVLKTSPDQVKTFLASLGMLRKKVADFLSHPIQINEEFEDFLNEGVHDPDIFRAVFVVGGPASGKNFVSQKLFSGTGLRQVDSDEALEHLMRKNQLSFLMPDHEEKERTALYHKGIKTITKKADIYTSNRLGLVVNSTGSRFNDLKKQKEELEALGYKTMLVFVQTDNETSKKRNWDRGNKKGGRSVPESIRQGKWNDSQKLKPIFQDIFGSNFVEVDNSESLDLDTTLKPVHKKIEAWRKEPHSPEAEAWIKLHKRDYNREPKGSSKLDSTGDHAGGQFRKKLAENTPIDREWGKTSLVKIYADETPGQGNDMHVKEIKKIMTRKVVKAKSSGSVGPRGVGVNTGTSGASFGASISMAPGLSEAVRAWAFKPETQERFIEKYGDRAEEKLMEAAYNLSSSLGEAKITKAKNIRELIDYGMQTTRMSGPKQDEMGEDGVKKRKTINITKKRKTPNRG